MIINSPKIKEINTGNIQISFDFESSPFAESALQYEIESKFQDVLSDSLDSALIALLAPCMISNEPIVLKGNLSRRLFTSLPSIQILLNAILPELHIIPITCSSLIGQDKPITKSSIATGFSGGVDSFATVIDIKPENFSYFLYNNVGSHGGAGESLFYKRFNALAPCAEKLGIPFIKVNSNLGSFFDEDLLHHVYNHTLRDISVALLLQKGINQYYYASAYHFFEADFSKRDSIAQIDPALLPLLSTENIAIYPHGSAMTRVEKTSLITTDAATYEYLDVCVDETNESNCSNCTKCRRTMATLDILGKLDLYDKVFDLPLFYKKRSHIFFDIFLDKSCLAKEVVRYANDNNYDYPSFSKFSSKISKSAMPHLPYRVRKLMLGRKPYKNH